MIFQENECIIYTQYTESVDVEVIDLTDDVDADETDECESDDDTNSEDVEVVDLTEDEDIDDTTISDIIEEIEEGEIENGVPLEDIPDECSDDVDDDELLKQLEDRLVDTTDEVLSVEQNGECDDDIEVTTVRTIWSDPEPDDAEDMRKQLEQYAAEDEEEEDRRRSNHYKHNKRNKHR